MQVPERSALRSADHWEGRSGEHTSTAFPPAAHVAAQDRGTPSGVGDLDPGLQGPDPPQAASCLSEFPTIPVLSLSPHISLVLSLLAL